MNLYSMANMDDLKLFEHYMIIKDEVVVGQIFYLLRI